MGEDGVTLDEVLALLGAKVVEVYALSKQLEELQKQAGTNDKPDTDKE